MNSMEKYNESVFENIKHIDEVGNEYWEARELQKVLGYAKWQKFEQLIERAKNACINSNNDFLDHFTQVGKMVEIGSGAYREQVDYKLSRYACYLIVQNGDSRKEVIALGQTYFAVQTRKQQLLEENFKELSEDEKRLIARKKVKEGNLGLNRTAINSGVTNLPEFHNAGYRGLYNGESADDIFKRKGLNYREEILDHMGSTELAANLFRITQTDDKLKRDKVDNQYTANSVHYEIGRKVRKAIKDMGGIMPEDLPTPEKSIKELENNEVKKINAKNNID